MKTKNILLPAIAILAGTLLSAPAYAQLYSDYHDTVEAIRQDINIERPTLNTVQKSYIDVVQLFNQMNEDLPIDYEKLLAAAINSIKDNQISNKDQYDLMVFAIQTNHNKVLETLLKAGFKANIDVELNEAGTTVAPLAEITQKFQNEEAAGLIDAYTPKARLKKMPLNKSVLKEIQKIPHGEYLKKTDYNHGAILRMEPSAYKQMLDSIRKSQNK